VLSVRGRESLGHETRIWREESRTWFLSSPMYARATPGPSIRACSNLDKSNGGIASELTRLSDFSIVRAWKG